MRLVKEQVWHNGRMYERGEQVADDSGIPESFLQNEEDGGGPQAPEKSTPPKRGGRR